MTRWLLVVLLLTIGALAGLKDAAPAWFALEPRGHADFADALACAEAQCGAANTEQEGGSMLRCFVTPSRMRDMLAACHDIIEGVRVIEASEKIMAELRNVERKSFVFNARVPASMNRTDVLDALRDTLAAAHIQAALKDGGKLNHVRVSVPREHWEDALTLVASRPEISRLVPANPFTFHNQFATHLLQGGQMPQGAYPGTWPFLDRGLNGSGQIIGLADTGIDMNHCFFYDPNVAPPYGTTDMTHRKVVQYVAGTGGDFEEYTGHGTHVAGSMAGYTTCTGYAPANGLAVDARIAFTDLEGPFTSSSSSPSSSSATDPLADPTWIFDNSYADPINARVHVAAWGVDTTAMNRYQDADANVDTWAYEHPDALIIVAAGGSTQARYITPPALAKNVLTVGMSTNSYESWNCTCTSGCNPVGFCSYAPSLTTYVNIFNASDVPTQTAINSSMVGYFKPDIVAPGERIMSSKNTSPGPISTPLTPTAPCNPPSGRLLDYDSGTSMAAGAVGGLAAIVRQYLTDGWYPSGSPVAADVLEPSGALMKALIINGASTMNGYFFDYNNPAGAKPLSALSTSYPNLYSGYGQASLPGALYLSGGSSTTRHAISLNSTRQDNSLASGGTASFCVTVVPVNGVISPLKFVMTYWDTAGGTTVAFPTTLVANIDLCVTYLNVTTCVNDSRNPVEQVTIQSPVVYGDYCAIVTRKDSQLPARLRYTVIASGPVGVVEQSYIPSMVTPSVVGPIAPGVCGFTVSWPAASSPSLIVGYQLQVAAGNSWVDLVSFASNSVALSFLHSNLANNTMYLYRVRARNADGVGMWGYGNVSTGTGTVAPTNLTAASTVANPTTTLNITWLAALTCTPGLRYVLQGRPYGVGNFSVLANLVAPVFFVHSNLQIATTYEYQVRTNATGALWSALANGTTASSAPNATGRPTVATQSDTVLRIVWTASAPNGSPVLFYVVSLAPTGGALFNACNLTALTCDVTGLQSLTTYNVRVQAFNALGASPFSFNGTNTTYGAPSVPAAPRVTTASDTTMQVTWTAPANNGGVILYYLVLTSTGGAFTQACNVSALTCTPSGLTPLTTYLVRVSAWNVYGGSPISANSTNTTFGAPAAPNKPAVVTLNTTAFITSWTANASNGAPITNYLVFIDGPGIPTTQVCSTPTLTCVILGLTPNTTYTVRVRAINIYGTSPFSINGTNQTLPITPPLAPSKPTLVPVNGTALAVNWTAPANGGLPILYYTVELSPNGGAYFVGYNGSAISVIVTGLLANTTYTVRIKAWNAFGGSPYSPNSTYVGPPNAPGTPVVTPVSAFSLFASWSSGGANGAPILYYTVYLARAGSGFAVVYNGTSLSGGINGLIPATQYLVRVTATNVYGVSQFSNNGTATTLCSVPDAPGRPVVAVVSSTALQITWVAPISNGAPILYYLVYAGAVNNVSSLACNTSALSCPLSGLDPGVMYIARLVAFNALGSSPFSLNGTNVTYPLPGAGPPYTPSAPCVTAVSSTSLTFSWTAPPNNGSAILSYQLSLAVSPFTVLFDGFALSFTVTGLAANTTILVRLTATNYVGTSAFSATAAGTTSVGPPNAPLTPVVSNIAARSFDVSLTSGGGLVEYYEIQLDGGTSFATAYNGTSSFVSLTGLTPRINYIVKARAGNGPGGLGPFSATTTAFTLADVPDAPTTVKARPSGATPDTSLDVSWSVPADNGASITGYNVDFSDTSGMSWTSAGSTAGPFITIPGLAPATIYFVRVQAVNSVGPSAYSSNAVNATAAGVPSIPVASVVNVNATSFLVIWSTSLPNGAIVASYSVELSVWFGAWTTNYTGMGPALFTRLRPGTAFSVRVRARNIVGYSGYSDVIGVNTSATAPDPPGAPYVCEVTPLFSISWSIPYANGAPIVDYMVEKFTSSGWSLTCLTAAPPCLVFLVNPGDSVQMRVTAINALGQTVGAVGTITKPGNPPDAPTPPSYLTGSFTSLGVEWFAPTTHGSPITGYVLMLNGTADRTSFVFKIADGTSTSFTATGLAINASYAVRVAANSSAGMSPFSNATIMRTTALPTTIVVVTTVTTGVTSPPPSSSATTASSAGTASGATGGTTGRGTATGTGTTSRPATSSGTTTAANSAGGLNSGNGGADATTADKLKSAAPAWLVMVMAAGVPVALCLLAVCGVVFMARKAKRRAAEAKKPKPPPTPAPSSAMPMSDMRQAVAPIEVATGPPELGNGRQTLRGNSRYAFQAGGLTSSSEDDLQVRRPPPPAAAPLDSPRRAAPGQTEPRRAAPGMGGPKRAAPGMDSTSSRAKRANRRQSQMSVSSRQDLDISE